jgi:hypothetical protein
MYSTWVGSSLSRKHFAMLERLVAENHSSLLRTFVNYERKEFYNIGTDAQAGTLTEGEGEGSVRLTSSLE